MKKISLFSMLIFALSMAACGAVDTGQESTDIIETGEAPAVSPTIVVDTIVEEELGHITFENAIGMSDCVFVGECVEMIDKGAYVEHKFHVLETLCGEIDEDMVYVYSTVANVHVPETGYEYERVSDCYVPGEKYLLITVINNSIMYEHDRYMTMADMVLCLDTEEYRMYGENERVEIPEGREITEYVSEVYAATEHRTIEKKSVTYDDKFSELIGESQYIAVVEVQKVEYDSVYANSTAFRCVPTTILRGGSINTYHDGSIILSVEKGSMQIGEQYIVGFGSDSETSLIYMQSVRGGVYPVSDDLGKEIMEFVQ